MMNVEHFTSSRKQSAADAAGRSLRIALDSAGFGAALKRSNDNAQTSVGIASQCVSTSFLQKHVLDSNARGEEDDAPADLPLSSLARIKVRAVGR